MFKLASYRGSLDCTCIQNYLTMAALICLLLASNLSIRPCHISESSSLALMMPSFHPKIMKM